MEQNTTVKETVEVPEEPKELLSQNKTNITEETNLKDKYNDTEYVVKVKTIIIKGNEYLIDDDGFLYDIIQKKKLENTIEKQSDWKFIRNN